MTHIHRLQDIPVHTIPIGTLRLLAGLDLMVFWAEVKGGTEAPRHSHPNEQITWLMEGRMDYKIGDGPVVSCGPGTVLQVPPDTPHHAWYREHCKIVEFFTPPRLDLFPAAATHPYGVAP